MGKGRRMLVTIKVILSELTEKRQQLDDHNGQPTQTIGGHNQEAAQCNVLVLAHLRRPQANLAVQHKLGHARVADGNEHEYQRVDHDEYEHAVVPARNVGLVHLQCNAHAVAPIEIVLEAFTEDNGQDGHGEAGQPGHTGQYAGHSHGAPFVCERIEYGQITVARDDQKDEHRRFRAHRVQHARQLAPPTGSPFHFMVDVIVSVECIVNANHVQVHAHQQIGKGQVFDEERVDLERLGTNKTTSFEPCTTDGVGVLAFWLT